MNNCNEIWADRRRFAAGIGLALLTAHCAPSTAHAPESSSRDGSAAARNLIIRSSLGFLGHTHDLLIPYAVLSAPPRQGARLESTRTGFHTHKVVLTQDQLMVVNHGRTVSAIAGSHTFVIALAGAIRARTSAPQRRHA